MSVKVRLGTVETVGAIVYGLVAGWCAAFVLAFASFALALVLAVLAEKMNIILHTEKLGWLSVVVIVLASFLAIPTGLVVWWKVSKYRLKSLREEILPDTPLTNTGVIS